MKRVLIRNADWIITMDERRSRIRNGDILIEGNKIIAIGRELDTQGPVDEVIDASGKVVTPGFVNVHHHSFQSLVRNITVANGLKLEPWLHVVFEIFKELTPDAARAGIYAGYSELLKTGCTTSNDQLYAHPVAGLIDASIEAAADLGIRFHPTRGCQTQESELVPKELVWSTDAVLEDTERLIKKYHDPDRFSMCQLGIAPCIALYEPEDILHRSYDFAEKHDIKVHGHLAETAAEVEYSLEVYGCRPAEWFRRMGILGERFYYAHCIHLDDEEVKLLAQTNTGVSHCPVSNMFLNSGVCRIPEMMDLGVRVGLGVDGSASSNSSNMMQEIRSAYLVNRLTWGGTSSSAEDILYLATVGGAKVLGREDIGYLAPGMAADLVLMDWDQLQYAGGKNDPVACIVLSGDSRLVDSVMVNGRLVVEHGKLLTIDEQKTSKYVNEVGKDLLRRASTHLPGLEQDII